jgi:malonyl-CoA/methylmalonyl-CoA synthetase
MRPLVSDDGTPMRTLVDALLERPAERPAVRTEGGVWTHGDLAQRSAAVALHLRDELAVAPGDRVALLFEPGPGFVATLYGIWRASAAALVLTHLHPPRERSRLLDDAGAELVLASAGFATEAERSAAGRRVVVIDGPSGPGAEADTGAHVALRPAPDQLALVVYTSGTTSTPKGVMLRHRHLEAQCAALAAAWEIREDDVLVHALPLHHVHGLVIALLDVLRVGGSALMLPGFDEHEVLAACGHGTVFMGVPTMYARLVDALDAMPPGAQREAVERLARMRLCTSGSAALPVRVGGRWTEHVGSYPVERFGMTELGVALSNPLDGQRVPGSVGWPLPGVGIRVVSDDGADAEEGELLVAGPGVFEGYWRRPQETGTAFVIDDGVRWFRTGDTVRRDPDGSVRVLGRTSVDILKSAGYKLSAPEIEEAIRRHPAVRDAAVVGLPDETYGQRVAAAVMLGGDGIITPDELIDFLRDELAGYQLPRLVRIVDDLPRNALGKVVKPELVRLLAG